MSDEQHAEWLNMEAYLALEGLRPLIVDRLVNLLRSEAPIDPIVRQRIADCLEASKNTPGIRLEVAGVGKGDKDLPAALIETRRKWLLIGAHIEKLTIEGLPVEEAKRRVEQIRDPKTGLSFGFRESQAGKAWNYYKKYLEYRATCPEWWPPDMAAGCYIMDSVIADRPDFMGRPRQPLRSKAVQAWAAKTFSTE